MVELYHEGQTYQETQDSLMRYVIRDEQTPTSVGGLWFGSFAGPVRRVKTGVTHPLGVLEVPSG
jgi:hypothetical protein